MTEGGWVGWCRRRFLASTGAAIVTTGGVLGVHWGERAQGQDGLRVRRSLGSLDADSEELRLLSDAIRILKDRGASDPLGWAFLADHHKNNCSASLGWSVQVHANWKFLPWHRLYLLVFERHLQAAVNEPTFALPYWNWFEQDEVPPAFSDPSSPLFHANRELAEPRLTAVYRGSTERDNYPEREVSGFLGREPPPLVSFWERAGVVERVAHNGVHGWVGGDMSRFETSARDPLFYMHHSNVDRLWEVWKNDALPGEEPWQERLDRTWLESKYELLDVDGGMLRLTALDMLNTEDLGYRYDEVLPRDPRPPSVPRLDVASEGSPLSLSFGDSAPGRPIMVGASPLVLGPIELSSDSRDALAVGGETGESRIILRLVDVAVSDRPITLSVFLNRPDATMDTDPEGPTYAGSFTYIPVADEEGTIVVDLDITTNVRQLGSSLQSISVTILRTGQDRNRDISDSVTIGDIELRVE